MSYDVLEKELRLLPESDEEFQAKMRMGLEDVREGRYTPLEEALADIKHSLV